MKKVVILGAGLVTRPIVRYLLDHPDFEVEVASRTVSKAVKLIDNHPQGTASELNLKNEELLKIGLSWLQDLKENEVPKLHASNPHKLGRTMDVIDILTCDEIIIQASLARKSSSTFLGFTRLDYPDVDPPEWNKWITIKLENGQVKVGELPIDFWAPLKQNYEANNKDYVGQIKE